MRYKIYFTALLLFSTISCLEKNGAEPNPTTNPEPDPDPNPKAQTYVYPFASEAQNVVAEITLQTDGTVDLNGVTTEIPPLKYNKSWLLMLTQDDCKHAAYSCTWAAINGKPLSSQYYYSASQLKAGDLPPDAYYLGKTLGSTDGAGNEVRFSFATTLAPEYDWMSDNVVVNKGYTANNYRFFMKDGLVWENVVEMCNYGVGTAFHDVKATDVNNSSLVAQHYATAQGVILDKLSGRGCKFLAEPNGNKAYITAAQGYAPIQTITMQNSGSGFTGEALYPFQVTTDLNKKLLLRTFYDVPEQIKSVITTQLALPKEDRKAVLVGTHATDANWVQFLQWLNDNYGKDGDNSLWMPSQEEYYEYNYYRVKGSVQKQVTGSTLKITVTMPSGQYFYYPAVTVNVKGLAKAKITSVTSSGSVTGLSHADISGGVMINLDCRKHLTAHATHFVEQYEAGKTSSNKQDALYFVNMLKASATKDALLQRIK